METFQEFNTGSSPEKSSGSIISHAYEMYKGTFLYVILAMVIYIVASMIIQPVSGFDSQDLAEEIQSSGNNFMRIDFWSIPGLKVYSGLSMLFGILVAPLYVGLIYIANKYNFGQQITFSDLFIGYKQNFVNILIYSLISSIILFIAFAFCFLPVIFVMPFFLLGYPVLLFENASFSEALSKSFTIAKENYGTFLGASFFGFLISISGIFLCGIGILATALFYFVVMYSAYCAFCGKPRQIGFKD